MICEPAQTQAGTVQRTPESVSTGRIPWKPLRFVSRLAQFRRLALFLPILAILCTAVFLSAGALAGYQISLEEREREDYGPYTLADIAAARLAVYGILPPDFRTPQEQLGDSCTRLEAVGLLYAAFGAPEKAANPSAANPSKPANKRARGRTEAFSFSDVPEEYQDAVTWACRSRIAKSVSKTEFGCGPVTEAAFVSMLLNALGCSQYLDDSNLLSFARSMGIAPPGLPPSRSSTDDQPFTWGDAVLYLDAVSSLSLPDSFGELFSVRERMNIRPSETQATFPYIVTLTPVSWEAAEEQMEYATRFLPEKIVIRGTYLSRQALAKLYQEYAQGETGRQDHNTWFISRCDPELDADACMGLPEFHPPYNDAGLTELYRLCRRDTSPSVTVFFDYNTEWKLACDADDAFQFYTDDTVSRRADAFYRRHVAWAETDQEAITLAKNAILLRAAYARPRIFDHGEPVYALDTHSIIGFLKNGQLVCDGYASTFQYLMHRAGIDCVQVSGSTVSRKMAEEERLKDHVWNKVRLDGHWYNYDICWADTGYPYRFDCRDDDFYAGNRHWAMTMTDLC